MLKSTLRVALSNSIMFFFFFLNDGRSKLASFFYHFLIAYQAIYLFAAIETDAKNFTGKIGVIELVLRTVMYLISYFRGIMWVDC